MGDRLLTYSEAGGRLLLSETCVRELVAAGKLKAKCIVVRGKGDRPRKGVPESEVDRFIGDLADVGEDGKAAKVQPEKPDRRQGLKGVRAELAAVPRRCR